MNLSPEWVTVLQRHGWETVHWSTVGDPRATDPEIMAWANAMGSVVFTHDLGFGGPSVIQVRTQDVTPGHLEPILVTALRTHDAALEEGALVTVDEARSRIRIPIRQRERI